MSNHNVECPHCQENIVLTVNYRHPKECKCNGEGWVWRHELEDTSDWDGSTDDTKYTCDKYECDLYDRNWYNDGLETPLGSPVLKVIKNSRDKTLTKFDLALLIILVPPLIISLIALGIVISLAF